MANDLIYFVEDDVNIYDLIEATLKVNGFDSMGFYEPLSMLKNIQLRKPDLILLDLMLPNMNGYEVIKFLKSKKDFERIPIIFVSAKSSENDIVKGLDLGANDYITKPFGIKELISRIKVNINKTVIIEKNAVYNINELRLDTDQHRFYVNDNLVELTLTEFQLLEYLMSNNNHVMTRHQLLKEIWGYTEDTETRTLDMHIRALREKIKRHSNHPYIETVRGLGYVINGELETCEKK